MGIGISTGACGTKYIRRVKSADTSTGDCRSEHDSYHINMEKCQERIEVIREERKGKESKRNNRTGQDRTGQDRPSRRFPIGMPVFLAMMLAISVEVTVSHK